MLPYDESLFHHFLFLLDKYLYHLAIVYVFIPYAKLLYNELSLQSAEKQKENAELHDLTGNKMISTPNQNESIQFTSS